MRSLVFEGQTWIAYEKLRQKDKKLHAELCLILKEIDPATGRGKPEPLKYHLSGLWSRRLSQQDRLIYKYDDDAIYIFAIGGHYDQF
ncbi:toxin YoeB [Methylohalomonas lacus]|uniref:Putative mRNA interferase YoeB n=1 Tax=Methylohalomonas lacus TaxID=398773 RepID=A0AAE3L4V0_9GAMM|nr:Txe/YoeB family addiction module toxin [Methylohalomonas lacus]MCS3904523.1 toxin YoeB [Methylohalomonas lacus]